MSVKTANLSCFTMNKKGKARVLFNLELLKFKPKLLFLLLIINYYLKFNF